MPQRSDTGDLRIPHETREMVLVWGDLWVQQKRQGMVLVGETCEYHSRGEEYMGVRVTCGTTADWKSVIFVPGRPVNC